MHSIVGLLLIATGPFGYPLALLGPGVTDVIVIEEQEVRLQLEDGACAVRLSAILLVRPTTDATRTLYVPAWKVLDSWVRPPARSGVARGAPLIGPPGVPIVGPPRCRPVEVRVDGRVVSTTLHDSARHAFDIDMQPPRRVEVEVTTRIDSVAMRTKSVLEKRRYRFAAPRNDASRFVPNGASPLLPQSTMAVHVDTRGLKSESIASVHPLPDGSASEAHWTWSVLPEESTVFEIVVTEFDSVAEFVAKRHASPRSWHEAWRLAYACNLITNEPHHVREIVEKGLATLPEDYDREASVRLVLMHQLALAENTLGGETGDAASHAEEALAKASGRSIETVRSAELFRGAARALEDSFVRGERMAPWQAPGWPLAVLTGLIDGNGSRDQPLGTGRKR